jgi:hypothetical protein
MVILPRGVRSVMTPVSLATITVSLTTRDSASTVTPRMATPGESPRLSFVLTTVTNPGTLLERPLAVNASLHARIVKLLKAPVLRAIRTTKKSSLSFGKTSASLNALRVTLWSRMNANLATLPAPPALVPLITALPVTELRTLVSSLMVSVMRIAPREQS